MRSIELSHMIHLLLKVKKRKIIIICTLLLKILTKIKSFYLVCDNEVN